jgi:hypothetical protein
VNPPGSSPGVGPGSGPPFLQQQQQRMLFM